MRSYVRRGLDRLREAVSRSAPHGEPASETGTSHKPFQDVLKKMAEAKKLNPKLLNQTHAFKGGGR